MFLLLPLGVLACAQDSTQRLGKAIADYDAGRFESALTHAESARTNSTGETRAEAAYVGGLAAARLDRVSRARLLLTHAASSSDYTISARANVSLGTILLEDDEPLSAAHAFDRAATKLVGEEADRARYLAGVAYREAGDAQEARRRFSSATTTGNTELARQATSAIDVTGFSIQAGAYKDRSKAERCAQECSSAAVRIGIGVSRIIPIQRNGSRLYAVQVGSFPTRADAEDARRRLGVVSGTLTRVERIAVAEN
jgi:tetratricopeptide (TPR) repeat protein